MPGLRGKRFSSGDVRWQLEGRPLVRIRENALFDEENHIAGESIDLDIEYPGAAATTVPPLGTTLPTRLARAPRPRSSLIGAWAAGGLISARVLPGLQDHHRLGRQVDAVGEREGVCRALDDV